ncbi:family 4 glycosyl hydrolase [Tardisphaera miroshnichenkoae]
MVNVYANFTGFELYEAATKAADDVEELAPNAWFIEIANPVFEVFTLLGRTRPKLKGIGYCHGAVHGVRLLATRALGLDFDRVEFKVAGFNHVVFLKELRYEGENAYGKIDDWIANKARDFWKKSAIGPWGEGERAFSRAAADMHANYDRFPPGDTARSRTWKYHRDLKTKQRWYGPTGGVDSEMG